jgi:hypothetical protein
MDDWTDSGEADQTHGFKGSFIWSGPSVGIIVRLLYRMISDHMWGYRFPAFFFSTMENAWEEIS